MGVKKNKNIYKFFFVLFFFVCERVDNSQICIALVNIIKDHRNNLKKYSPGLLSNTEVSNIYPLTVSYQHVSI